MRLELWAYIEGFGIIVHHSNSFDFSNETLETSIEVALFVDGSSFDFAHCQKLVKNKAKFGRKLPLQEVTST